MVNYVIPHHITKHNIHSIKITRVHLIRFLISAYEETPHRHAYNLLETIHCSNKQLVVDYAAYM